MTVAASHCAQDAKAWLVGEPILGREENRVVMYFFYCPRIDCSIETVQLSKDCRYFWFSLLNMSRTGNIIVNSIDKTVCETIMTQFKSLFVFLSLGLAVLIVVAENATGSFGFFQETEIQRKKVKRVKRPVFTERDSNGIYFGSVFDEAIQGDRPTPMIAKSGGENPSANVGEGEGANGDFAWSQYISGDVIETEIKRLQKSLAQQVTSPGKYKTEYKDARYSFQMLSMLFGIIIEHDEDVRWKRIANLAQPSYSIAAKKARRGDTESYNYAVARRDDLAEIVRGGNLASTEKPVENLDWSETVGRTPLMKRLQDSVDRVKPWLSSKAEFEANQEEILHEANLIAAMSEILGQESMDDAEEDDYLVYVAGMSRAAQLMTTNTKTNNYDAVSEGFNQVNQACSNCHDEWR